MPHEPQLAGSDSVSMHVLLLQSVYSVSHLKPHWPWLQVDVECATAARHGVQLVPHELTSSSFTHAPLQSWVLAGHWHCPALHDMPVPQRMPQPPQFAASVVRSTHAPEQSVKPPLQAMPQLPCAHVGSACSTLVVHLLPHCPQ